MLSQQLLGKHLQIYWEFIQEHQIVLSTIKERNLSVHLRKSVLIKNWLPLELWISWTQGKRIPWVFRSCKKDFYKNSGKSQVGCMRIGRRHSAWSNQYKSCLQFYLPLSYLFYCNQFCITHLKNIIKLIVTSSYAFWAYPS